jgi:serine/threonine-protein kinase
VKLMDFGVAATSARKDTEAGAVRGTFSYMAPEQVRGRTLDKRADVFALGVVLYELSTGTRLFRGTDVQIMTQVVEHDAPPPSSRAPGYPADLEEIVLGALSRDRSARIPSAAHLAVYLEELAMRNGHLIGPRAVARYAASVLPAERVREEDLALVQASEKPRLEVLLDSTPRSVWTPSGEAPLPDIDENALLDDLQLLSVPAEVNTDHDSEPIDLVDAVEELDQFIDNTVDDGRQTYLTLEESESLRLGKKFPEQGRKDARGDYVDELERRLSSDPQDES